MGIKHISILIVMLLIISGLLSIASAVTNDDNNIVPHSSRAKDNNNSFDEAVEMQNGTTYVASVNYNDDPYDFYKIPLSKVGRNGHLLNITLEITDTFGVIAYGLFNPELYQIGNDFFFAPFTRSISREIFVCSPGYYFIVVMAASSTAPNVNYKLTGVHFWLRRNTDEDNTNDTAQTAFSGMKQQDRLHPVLDYLDLYNITLTSTPSTADGLLVELNDFEDDYLVVYNPDGTIREFSDIVVGSQGDKEIVKFIADQSGIYRIAVGISGAPTALVNYQLNTTITAGVAADKDYDEDHATRVYDGTIVDTAFDSEFDVYDYYVMELNQSDNLTVSVLFTDGSTDLDIEIYSSGADIINYEISQNDNGLWTNGTALLDETDYFIKVENQDLDKLANYSIMFSLNGENILFQPMIKNDTNLDFSMPEDSVNFSAVNLNDIFYDPDSAITFGSPSHPNGIGTNIDMETQANGSVKFMPHQDFYGYEVFNFSATDIVPTTLYWEVNVTVTPVNDAPVLTAIVDQVWTQGEDVNISVDVSDIDSTELVFTDNTTMFDVDAVNKSIIFIPTNDHVGLHHINITVSDGEINRSTEFDATILNVNDPPVFISVGGEAAVPDGSIELNAIEDALNEYSVNVSDIDRDIGIMDVFRFNDNITGPLFMIDLLTGNISFTPLQEHVGIFYARISVEDGKGGIAWQNLSITVINVNDPPGKPEVKLENINGTTASFSVENVSDEDGDMLTYIWDFGDSYVYNNSGLVTNHTYATAGDYTINVTVSDGYGGSSWNALDIHIDAPDDGNGTNGNGTNGNGTNGNGTNGNGTGNGKKVDTDNDGLDDDWELSYFGDLSHNGDDDSDKDGYSNKEEFDGDTDPTDPYFRPIDKTDTDDQGGKSSISPTTELMLYITGIGIIVTIVLLLVIIMLMVIRKPTHQEFERGVAQPQGTYGQPPGEGEVFTVPCPECGRNVPGDAMVCAYCGEELEPGFERPRGAGRQTQRRTGDFEDDDEYSDDKLEDWDDQGREWDDEETDEYSEDDEYYDEEEGDEEYDEEYDEYSEDEFEDDEEYYEEEEEDEYSDEDEWEEEQEPEEYDDEEYDEDTDWN